MADREIPASLKADSGFLFCVVLVAGLLVLWRGGSHSNLGGDQVARNRRGLDILSDSAVEAMFYEQVEINPSRLGWVTSGSAYFGSDDSMEDYAWLRA